MGDTAKIRRTITDLGYAPITAIDADGRPSYDPVIWFPHHKAGGRDYDAQPAGTSGGIYADGREIYAYDDNNGYNVTLTTVGVTDDIDEDWYGLTVSEDGAEEYSNGAEYPPFALVIIEDTTDGIGETTIFPMCRISQRSTKQGTTSEGNGLNPQFPQHSIAARPRLDCMLTKMVLAGKAKIAYIPTPSKYDPDELYVYEDSDGYVYEGTDGLVWASERGE
jgi:hypothetical protein